jgi:glutamyl-tRNA reductase
MMGQFRLLSFSTNAHNVKSDSFYLKREEIEELMDNLKTLPGMKEAFIMSIPERTEILYFGTKPLQDQIYSAISSCNAISNLPFQNEFQQTSDEKKIFEHLSELCFGIQSFSFGATPLFPQYIQAFSLALENGWIGDYIDKWWNHLIATNKFIKNQADYQLPNFSISFTVSDMVSELVKNIKHPKIALIGFSTLSKKVYQNLTNQGFKKISIVGESIKPFSSLNDIELNNFIFEQIDQVENVIQENDIIISSLEGGERILHADYFNHNYNSTKIFVDLSIKSNFSDALDNNDQVIPFDLSDIYKIIERKIEINKKWIKKSKPTITKMNHDFFNWLDKKRGQEMLVMANGLLTGNIFDYQYHDKGIVIDESLIKNAMVFKRTNIELLKKSIEKINSKTKYKDILNYKKLVNDFYQYN